MKDLRIYIYKDAYITFMANGDTVLVNADEMAAPFGKKPEEWLNLPSTQESFKYAYERDFQPYKIQKRNKKTTCTLLVDIYALEFARWLSLEFYFWFKDSLKDFYMGHLAVMNNTHEPPVTIPDDQNKLLEDLKAEREAKEKALEQLEYLKSTYSTCQDYVVYANALVDSSRTMTVGELAKLLRENECRSIEVGGYSICMNQENLMEWFRENGIFGTSEEHYNEPKEEYIKRGLFECTGLIYGEMGKTKYEYTAKITGRGQLYYINYFLTGEYPNISDF